MSLPRRENPIGTVPVLMMNPDERDEHMAARKRSTRRKTTARKTSTRRRTTRRAAPKRRRRTTRRKKNPSFDMMGTAVAALGGAAAGAGAYALDGTTLSPNMKLLALAGGGIVAGMLVGGWSKAAGCGIAGAGVGMAAKAAMDQYMAGQLGAIPSYAVAKFGHTPASPGYHHMPDAFGAVQADLSALGAVQADLSAVQADLSAVTADLV